MENFKRILKKYNNDSNFLCERTDINPEILKKYNIVDPSLYQFDIAGRIDHKIIPNHVRIHIKN